MINRIEVGRKIAAQFQSPIVLFTGGTGSRPLAMELAKHTSNISYLIHTADDGGSTGAIRDLFKNIPGIGDFRSRLIDLSDSETGGHKELLALMKHRLPKEYSLETAEKELETLIDGTHSLITAVKHSGSNLVDCWLDAFNSALRSFDSSRTLAAKKFDPRGASVGNLFLTGLYLLNDSLPEAISFYCELLSVKGEIIPATLENVTLAGRMNDGQTIKGQHTITAAANGPVRDLWHIDFRSRQKVEPQIFEGARKAIEEANLLVYSIGSLWTSIFSTLHIKGMAEAIRKSSAQKVFLIPSYEDAETRGMKASDMVDELLRVLRLNGGEADDSSYLTAVVGNTLFPPESVLRFVNFNGEIISREHPLIEVCGEELLSGDQKTFDPQTLAYILFSFLGSK
ncbi:hypothetical protein A2276_04955 [candidate division WOR-1 bacterium RIFOXYA12_FULL_43_27]|uniref:Gluconeogenesis factor n=1 Tax=candidate division WOR-1 bacterium RIFOXYC2_FULL_46_14 TaxID=1802587 RepID=A0A1F4U8B2_UNCSA|nr:MAG: hypothetical protein A2276_04955 [candidate division WOR-1 bacterium RIFOXYA12_FULL_43_27]OGC20015.1 MAG: hypothetical protein A2292_02960 [candidate division WOR-1 bacterium RIFOXYB2_FULL_46_45]OGC32248.1 MAG: hypothetical protein A2232_08485 [candidate division WOR-1 bacterium RIFOXYA2_FULL_46_56]OGC41152.1 MAG: hypothetical protein A2438_07425 [candidate division WOR-1 bacterium RIFOXYC2_FULL_46_14]